MTYQHPFVTTCSSVGLLHDFFYIQRVDILDVDEFIYVFSEMSNQPAEKLILILHPIFLRKWNVFMLHTSSHTTDC